MIWIDYFYISFGLTLGAIAALFVVTVITSVLAGIATVISR